MADELRLPLWVRPRRAAQHWAGSKIFSTGGLFPHSLISSARWVIVDTAESAPEHSGRRRARADQQVRFRLHDAGLQQLTEFGELVEFGGTQPDILQGMRELVARFAQAVLGLLADAQFLLLAVLRKREAKAVGDEADGHGDVRQIMPGFRNLVGQDSHGENEKSGDQILDQQSEKEARPIGQAIGEPVPHTGGAGDGDETGRWTAGTGRRDRILGGYRLGVMGG